MSTKDTLFTVAGITTHRGMDAKGTVSERTKVRYGTDLVRLVKMLSNPKKIEDKRLGICLAPSRVDFIDLPSPMMKDDAARYLLTAPEFQSAEDQAVINETLSARAPKVPRVKKPKAVKVAKAAPSIEAIKARAKKSVTVDQVLATVVAE